MSLNEADLQMTEQAFDSRNSQGNPGDQLLYVRFYLYPHHNRAKSTEEGRPIYEDREYIEIMQPGNKDSIINRLATPKDLKRFANQYSGFKNNGEEVLEGTPLKEWPSITRAQVEELKYFNVHTVEQLAGMTDANAQNFMGISQMKRRAEAFLASTKDSAAGEKLAAELAMRDSTIAVQAQQIEELTGRLTKLEEG